MATRAFGAERPVEQPARADAVAEAKQPGADRPDPPSQPGVEPAAAGEGVIDPAGISAGTEGQPKRHYKKHKQKYRTKQSKPGNGDAAGSASGRKAAAQATIDLNNILFSLHMMGASLLKMPSLVLTEEEAKHLANAITRVTELYEVPILDEKTRAWLNLSMVGFEVYGTRIVAAMADRKKKQPAPPPMVITPFRPQREAPPPPVVEGFVDVEVMNGQA